MVGSVEATHREHIDALMEKYRVTDSGGSVHLVAGDAGKVLPRLAESLDIGLIVMGTVARTGLSGLIMGNTAETILRSVRCSVLAVKPAGFVTPVKLGTVRQSQARRGLMAHGDSATAGTAAGPTSAAVRGLAAGEAARLLEAHGPNLLPEAKPIPWWARVGRQLRSPIIYILLFALAFDAVIWVIEGAHGWPIESIAILVILAFNTIMGVWQEYRAEDALARLKELAAPRVWVRRDGAPH